MSKKVLVISSSFRKGGNSEMLADEFIRGAEESGNIAEKVTLYDKTIGFCKGCLACQKTQKCVIRDDANEIADKMLTADVIVFATPIYYYEMCGQLKTILDRANPLYSADYEFRHVYLLAVAADKEDSAIDGAEKGISGWVSCFPKAKFAGKVFAGGVTAVGEIKNHAALQKAYDMGKSV
ncbi:MAG: flavodoxin family protein [Oscillospiraceae bacterium]|nr:flavodoxin family protein [Oscillospiraceae bacterium]